MKIPIPQDFLEVFTKEAKAFPHLHFHIDYADIPVFVIEVYLRSPEGRHPHRYRMMITKTEWDAFSYKEMFIQARLRMANEHIKEALWKIAVEDAKGIKSANVSYA